MADLTVLGMMIDLPEDDDMHGAQPLEAVLVAKVLDADGTVRYRTLATEGLLSVEALGMVHYAAAKLAHGLVDSAGDD